ncbi:MAG: ABC transporter permease [Bradymonadaceae bacterium]|nr:ABC transporter permease [Lujinxingiaceae bacterium]
MKDLLATWKVLVIISMRNLRSHRVKTLIVGFIMFFGTFLVVVGTSLLDSVEAGMTRSITSSLAGHLQIYSSEAKDKLALFGGLAFDNQDIDTIRDFSALKAAMADVPNVKAVVPLGIGVGTGLMGNQTDAALNDLRLAVRTRDAEGLQRAIDQVRQIAVSLELEMKNRLAVIETTDAIKLELELVARIQNDAFWSVFTTDDEPEAVARMLEQLEFLDTEIAPLTADGRMLFMRFFGTDLDLFAESFESFYIVRGERVPERQRGILIGDRTAERYLKHRVAREFDALHKQVVQEGRKIADSKVLQSQVQHMARQYNVIVLDLSPTNTVALTEKLRAYLDAEQGALLPQLVQSFLEVDDTTIASRHAWFYATVGPMIKLYAMDVGDTVTVRTMTQGGFMRAINLKVYGTFHFRGLETSDIAGTGNLVDMLTFRELYGVMTQDQIDELQDIRQAVGVEDIAHDDIEDALFGSSDSLVAAAVVDDSDEADSASNDNDNAVLLSRDARTAELESEVFTQEQIDHGIALNAAVVLHDASDLQASVRQVQAALDAASLKLQVVTWQSASGIVGQFITVIRLVLYIAISIIFLIALVIINNAMVMATIERTGEIGTMRAIGGQRSFIMTMFLIETLVLGAISGGLGALVGTLTILVCGHFGIAASSDVLVFLFSGPRLYPEVGLHNIAIAVGAILAISVLSTLYPARVATRIQPVTAMRTTE